MLPHQVQFFSMSAQCHSSVQTVYPFDKPSPFSVLFSSPRSFSNCVCVCASVFVSFEFRGTTCLVPDSSLSLSLGKAGGHKGPSGCVMAAPDKNTELIGSDSADACLLLVLELHCVWSPIFYFPFFFLKKTSTPISCVALARRPPLLSSNRGLVTTGHLNPFIGLIWWPV